MIVLDLIRLFIMALLLVGLTWSSILIADVQMQKRSVRIGYKLRRRLFTVKYQDYGLIRHLDRLMFLAARHYRPVESAIRFCLFCLLAAAAVFALLATFIPWQRSSALAVILGVGIPYLILRIRHAERGVKASYDLAEVIKLLSRHAHLPVHTALKHTAENLSDRSVLKRPVMVLADAFSSYGSKDELLQEALRFSSTIGTAFAVQLVMELIQAEKDGSKHLNQSLKFLNEAIEGQRNAVLGVKKENRDAIALGIWVNLAVIAILSWSTASFLTWGTFFRLLTQTEIGVTLSLAVAGSLVTAFFIGRVLSRPKLDY